MFEKQNYFREKRMVWIDTNGLNETSEKECCTSHNCEKLKKEVEENIQNIKDEKEFLTYSRDDQLKFITTEHADAKSVKKGDILHIIFGGNEELEGRITAQTLPEQAEKITVNTNGKELTGTRRGLTGEFYAENGERLKIYEGTVVTINETRDTDGMSKLQKEITEKVNNYSGDREIAKMAYEKGVSPKMLEIMAQGKKDNIKLQMLATKLGRKRGDFREAYQNLEAEDFDGKPTPEFVGFVFKNEEKIDDACKDFNIDQEKARRFHQESHKSLDLEKIPIPELKNLFQLIGRHESSSVHGGFNAYNREKAGDAHGPIQLTKMKISEIQERQRLPKGNPNRFLAVGFFQIIPGTLSQAMKGTGISPNELFSEENQMKLGIYLTFKKQPRLGNYLSGGNTPLESALNDLAAEWAGLVDAEGKHRYGGSAGNAAGVNMKLLEKEKMVLTETRSLLANNPKQQASL